MFSALDNEVSIINVIWLLYVIIGPLSDYSRMLNRHKRTDANQTVHLLFLAYSET